LVIQNGTDGISNNVSEIISIIIERKKEIVGSKYLWTDYQRRLSPEIETVYSGA
jgi:hypothetical protein